MSDTATEEPKVDSLPEAEPEAKPEKAPKEVALPDTSPTAEKATLIKAGDIKVPKWDPEERDFNLAQAQAIAASVASANKLLHPITVRPNPTADKDGKAYELVCGRQRLYACAKILGWTQVPAFIREFDDEMTRLTFFAENAFRHELSPKQRHAAIAAWQKLFKERMAKVKLAGGGSKPGPKPKAKAKPAEPEAAPTAAAPVADAPAPEAAPAEPEAAVAQEREDIYAEMAKMFGWSRTKAVKEAKIAKVLGDMGDAEKKVVYDAKPAAQTLYNFAGLDDENRAKALRLVASGMTMQEAVDQVGKTAKAEKAKEAASAGKVVNEDDLKDEDWLQTYLAEKIASITSERTKVKFKTDALLWRHMKPAREKVSKMMGSVISATEKSVKTAAYLGRVTSFLRAKHPKEWALCSKCGTTGYDNANQQSCSVCFGHGYRVITELKVN